MTGGPPKATRGFDNEVELAAPDSSEVLRQVLFDSMFTEEVIYLADKAQVRAWAKIMHDGQETLDSSQEAKVRATINQAGSEGKIVAHIYAHGKLPPGVT